MSKFSGGRVVNLYEKREINSKLQKMEAFFNEEVDNWRNLGLTPDKATLNRAIRRAKGLVADKPEVKFVLEKPDNIGALLRTADAMGVDFMLIVNPKTELYNPNVIRSSEGCLFSVPIVIASLDEAFTFLEKK